MMIPCLYLFRFSFCTAHYKKSPDRMVWGCGGELGTRTPDPLRVMQVL
mgnify:FL=1